MISSNSINDNVNLYDNNNRSFNNEISINNETKKNLNITKDNSFLNNIFKNDYYPTYFNLNLFSEIIKNNNVNSVEKIKSKIKINKVEIIPSLKQMK